MRREREGMEGFKGAARRMGWLNAGLTFDQQIASTEDRAAPAAFQTPYLVAVLVSLETGVCLGCGSVKGSLGCR
jgi:hypothetical protein